MFSSDTGIGQKGGGDGRDSFHVEGGFQRRAPRDIGEGGNLVIHVDAPGSGERLADGVGFHDRHVEEIQQQAVRRVRARRGSRVPHPQAGVAGVGEGRRAEEQGLPRGFGDYPRGERAHDSRRWNQAVGRKIARPKDCHRISTQ